jgi:predicted ABC-type transport system involved in lysophospholipase L1 biosynthesis ATPase subunit
MTSTRDEMRKLRENASGDRRQNMMQGRQIMENQDKQIEALLTADQKKIYEEVKKERREQMKERFQKSRHQFGEQRMEKRVEHLTTELSLTNEQQTQLREILSNAQQDFSKEIPSGNTDRETRRELFRQHFEKVDAQIRGILDEIQLQKYETLRAEMQQRRNEHFWKD